MPQTPHVEKHFTASESVRDIVIGMSDGLTVPFALAAGLSGAVASSGIIVTAGLAEVAAGAIAMGLGGYLAARTRAIASKSGLSIAVSSRKSNRALECSGFSCFARRGAHAARFAVCDFYTL